MDPLAGSSLISAGSKLLGGVFGGDDFSWKRMYEQLEAPYTVQNKMFPKTVSTRLSTAKKYGLHPLTALGLPLQTTQAGMIGGSGSNNIGSALAAAGQDVSRAVAASQTREQRHLADIHSRLSVERAGLENDLLRSQIASQRAQLAPSASEGLTGVKAALADLPTPLGSVDGTTPLHRTAYDEKGNPIRVYNSVDLGDSEILSAAHGLVYAMPDWIHGNIGRPAGRWLGRKVRKHFSKERR